MILKREEQLCSAAPLSVLIFFRRQSLQDPFVSVCTIHQAFVDPADGRRRGLGDGLDLTVGLVFRQKLGHLQPLRDGMDLVDRAYILEKPLAVLFILKQQDRPEQLVNIVSFEFRFVSHDTFLS